MKKKVATIILNRNLPIVTNKLYEHLIKYDGKYTDVYIVEAGSDKNNLSKYCTWYADSKNIKKNGLRYCRGMNFGLFKLFKEKKYYDYEAFFLITNDTELRKTSTIYKLYNIIKKNSTIGIISPCSKNWGEKMLIKKNNYKFFWFIHNNAYLLNRKFIDKVINKKNNTYYNFLFDGSNFRGFGSEIELISKAYSNNYAAAITTSVWAEENETYLIDKSHLIKTDSYEDNLNKYVLEGLYWMKNKYGFNSKWQMYNYVKNFYDDFFKYNPEFLKYKL